MKISNLEELRDVVNEEIITKIVTEYIMEVIARDQRYKAFEQVLSQKKDSDPLTVGEVKDKLETFNDDLDGFV